MHLETAESIEHKNVTEAQLREAFRDDKGRGEFITLYSQGKSGSLYFISAAGEYDDPYVLQYRDGDKKFYYRATGKFTKAQVEQAFLYYLNNDERWRTEFPWQKEVIKPWWKFW